MLMRNMQGALFRIRFGFSMRFARGVTLRFFFRAHLKRRDMDLPMAGASTDSATPLKALDLNFGLFQLPRFLEYSAVISDWNGPGFQQKSWLPKPFVGFLGF